MNPLMELKERLVYSTIAGTQLLQEDFRLKKIAEMFSSLAGKNPVMGRIDAQLKQLLEGQREQQPVILLNLLGLVDAVLYTQAVSDFEGDLIEPNQTSFCGTMMQVRYSQMQPLLQAIYGTGSGRLEILIDTMRYTPNILQDYRILHALIEDLDDSYGEMATCIYKLLYSLGTGQPFAFRDVSDGYDTKWSTYDLPKIDQDEMVTLLKKDFNPQSKRRAMIQRMTLIAAIAKEKENDWYLSLLDVVKGEMREQVISALGYCEKNVPLLLQMVKKERGKSKEMIYKTLAPYTFENMEQFWADILEKSPEQIVCLQSGRSDEISDIVAHHVKQQFMNATDKSRIDLLCMSLQSTVNKTSDAMFDLYRWLLQHEKQFDQWKTKESGKNWLGYTLRKTIKETLIDSCPPRLVDFLREIEDHPSYELLCFFADLFTLPADQVFDKWSIKKVQTEFWLESLCYEQGKYYLSFSNTLKRPLKEPLDVRWFTWMIEHNWKGVLERIGFEQSPEIRQKIGQYFYDIKEDKLCCGISQLCDYLDTMKRYGFTKCDEIILRLCTRNPNIRIWELRRVIEKYQECVDQDTFLNEMKRVLKFYEQKYGATSNTARQIKAMIHNTTDIIEL